MIFEALKDLRTRSYLQGVNVENTDVPIDRVLPGAGKFALAIGSLLIFVPVALLVVYTEWHASNFWESTQSFRHWPWLSLTCFVTTIVFLYPFFAYWRCQGQDTFRGEANTVAWIAPGVVLVLMNPGAEALGRSSDAAILWAIGGVTVIALLACRTVCRGIAEPPDPWVPAAQQAYRFVSEFNKRLPPSCAPLSEVSASNYKFYIADVLDFSLKSMRHLGKRRCRKMWGKAVGALVGLFHAGAAREYCRRRGLSTDQERVVVMGTLWGAGWSFEAAVFFADNKDGVGDFVHFVPEIAAWAAEAMNAGRRAFGDFTDEDPLATHDLHAWWKEWAKRVHLERPPADAGA